MTDESLRLETRGAVLIVTIARPERRNAVDHATALAIEAAIDRFEADAALHVAILTGADGVFSAGADLKAAAAGQKPARTERRGSFGLNEARPEKPIIAAVEGMALGGGCEMALSCDLVVAARNAVFGLPEIRRGLAAAAGGLLRLPNRVPFNVAMEMVLTGDPQPAERLYQLGLVNRLCEPGDALRTALGLAERIGGNSPLAVRLNKRMMLDGLDADEQSARARQQAALDLLRASDDYREGIRAFAEKRPPVWRGT
jgi:enoyl-CoA hydratase/carnithine racemase